MSSGVCVDPRLEKTTGTTSLPCQRMNHIREAAKWAAFCVRRSIPNDRQAILQDSMLTNIVD